jgi:hypothetical protein
MATLTALFDTFPLWGSVRPQMGESSCFLSIRGARFLFYMPILILLCFNTLMYLVTVYSLWKAKKLTQRAGLHRISTTNKPRKYPAVLTNCKEVINQLVNSVKYDRVLQRFCHLRIRETRGQPRFAPHTCDSWGS